jgi:hypothetical protein
MSKMSIATAAALIACVIPVAACAQSAGYAVPARQLRTQSKHLMPRAPSNVKAPVMDSGGFPARAVTSVGRFETDPDPRIRVEKKEIARHAHPALVASRDRRAPVDDCVHTIFPACSGGP